MTYELLAAAAARADDLGPVVELTITVELRRWQAAEALGLLEAGQEQEAAAVLADHALKAHTTGADGKALLWAGTLTVLHQDDGQWRTDSTVIIDTYGPAIDLVHPARSRDELATHATGQVAKPAPPGGPEKPSRWMAAFTREAAPC